MTLAPFTEAARSTPSPELRADSWLSIHADSWLRFTLTASSRFRLTAGSRFHCAAALEIHWAAPFTAAAALFTAAAAIRLKRLSSLRRVAHCGGSGIHCCGTQFTVRRLSIETLEAAMVAPVTAAAIHSLRQLHSDISAVHSGRECEERVIFE